MPIILPINSSNINSYAMYRKAYNRPDLIAILLKTLAYMKRVNRDVCYPPDDISQFVSINIVKQLARSALQYLLKVSYLDDKQEYIPAYELFDDVRSLQYRSRLAANIHEEWWGECESMFDELDSLHERFKTIRVCGGRRRYRNTVVKEEAPKQKVAFKFTSHQEPAVVPSKPFDIRPDESLEEYAERKEVMKSIKLTLDGFAKSRSLSAVEEVPKLIDMMNSIIGVFDNLTQHAEYIAINPSFRSRRQNNTQDSFLQVVISKCASLRREIEIVYDNVRRKHTRANPMLRSLKHKTLTRLTESLSILCDLYVKHPFEPESVDTLL